MPKKQKSKPATAPYFDPQGRFGGFGPHEIIVDQDGKLWRLDVEKGHATPVTFEK